MNAISHLKAGQIAVVLNDEGQMLPYCGESAERYVKLKRGVPYLMTIKESRNLGFHKKYFSMLNLAFENQEYFKETKWFRKHTLIALGYCTVEVDPFTGEVHKEADSISFDECTQAEFEEIYKNTQRYLMEKYCFDDKMFNRLRDYD